MSANTGGTSPATTLRWYLSTDNTLDTSDTLTNDTLVATSPLRSIPAGDSLSISNTITASNATGTYYYFACVDRVAGELEIANNCSPAVSLLVVFGARLPTSDFTTPRAAGNVNPEGIWSDGTTLWIADWETDKLYAYSLATKERLPAQDFNTLSPASNNSPSGIYSDGSTLWVADTRDDKLYAYSLATKERSAC